MIHHKLLPPELMEKAVKIFDAAFANKFRCFLSKQEDRFKMYRLIFSKTSLIYMEEDGELMGVLLLSTSSSPKMLTNKEIFSTLGLLKGTIPAIMFSAMQHNTPNHCVKIEFLAVDTEQRGKGIGTKLFDYVEQWAVDNNYTNLSLEVVGSNLDAKRLYNRIGFADVDVINIGALRKLLGWDFKEIYSMRKELQQA